MVFGEGGDNRRRPRGPLITDCHAASTLPIRSNPYRTATCRAIKASGFWHPPCYLSGYHRRPFHPPLLAVEKRPFHSPSGKTGEAKCASLPPTSFATCRLSAERANSGHALREPSVPYLRVEALSAESYRLRGTIRFQPSCQCPPGRGPAVSTTKQVADGPVIRRKNENLPNLAVLPHVLRLT